MSLVQVMLCISLDGYLADAQGGVGWLRPYETPEAAEDCGLEGFLANVDMVVMGRRTLDQVLGFGGAWPYAGKRVVVMTHRPLPDGVPAGVRVEQDLKASLTAARERGLVVWICGGAEVITQALSLGMVDEVELFTVPVILGSGQPWITPSEGHPLPRFELLACEGFRSGLTRSHYAVVAAEQP